METEKVNQLCTELNTNLESVPIPDLLMINSVAFLTQVFNLAADEIAILAYDDDKRILRFVAPHMLKKLGFIPISSHDSVAAKTAREGTIFLENEFRNMRHANFFEKIRLEAGDHQIPKPIQKIISVPMVNGTELKGVIQISRKGVNTTDSEDFTEKEAELLMCLAAVVAKYI